MKESKVFSIENAETGEITRIIEAQTERDVRAYLLKDVQIGKPAAMTVARLMGKGMKLESASS